jgi:hypothetical protein
MRYPNLPYWQRLAIPTVGVVLAILFWARYFVADELIFANYQIQALQEDLQTAHDRLDEERARATLAEREVDIVRRANALLRVSERERQDKIAGLQADLVFYRRLGGANGSQAALAVHDLELQSTQSPRVYRIIFTLTQNLRWAGVISGRIELGIDGIGNGIAQHLTEEQLLAESALPLSFQFKYFQQLERLITIPENFAASRLTIRLRSRSLRTPVERSMEWQSLFNHAASDIPANDPPVSVPDDCNTGMNGPGFMGNDFYSASGQCRYCQPGHCFPGRRSRNR